MENASKALLIAGEMLIAMLVASMMALLFSTMSSYADEQAQKRKIQEVQAFNANITQYAKENSTAQDIVSLVNFAKQMNEQMGCTGTTCINHEEHINVILLPLNENLEKYTNDNLASFLQDNYYDGTTSTGFKYYEAKIIDYFDDGKIQKINLKAR